MATSDAFNEKVEGCIAKLLREEYPHMKTPACNSIAWNTAYDFARHARER